jgi:hypothetical protein
LALEAGFAGLKAVLGAAKDWGKSLWMLWET